MKGTMRPKDVEDEMARLSRGVIRHVDGLDCSDLSKAQIYLHVATCLLRETRHDMSAALQSLMAHSSGQNPLPEFFQIKGAPFTAKDIQTPEGPPQPLPKKP